MHKVSAHSGLPDAVELRMLDEKYTARKAKRREQMDAILSILRSMPKSEANALLAQVFKEYRKGE